MAVQFQPMIGDWYLSAEGATFEVVAYDPEDETIEIQYFDGAVEELDLDTWLQLEIEGCEPPEDWSGSLDLMTEDYGVDLDHIPVGAHHSPLDDLEF